MRQNPAILADAAASRAAVIHRASQMFEPATTTEARHPSSQKTLDALDYTQL